MASGRRSPPFGPGWRAACRSAEPRRADVRQNPAMQRGPMKRVLAVAIVAAVLVLVVAACSGGTGNRDASPVERGAVTMKDNAFQPVHVQVPARTTVTWTNGDQVPHDVKFADGPQSEMLQFGGTYQRVFDTPGTYDYECTIHPGMVGRVTVTAR